MTKRQWGVSLAGIVAALAMAAAPVTARAQAVQAEGQVTVQTQQGYGQQPQPYGQPQAYPQQYPQQQPYPSVQPAYGAQPQPAREPREVQRPNLGLIISGAVMLGVSWIANIFVGLPAGDDPFVSGVPVDWDAFRLSSLIPVAGPWVQLAVKPTGFHDDYWAPYLIIDGLLQAGGLTLLVVGLATPRTETVYADLGGGVELGVLPVAGPGHGGLSAVGRF